MKIRNVLSLFDGMSCGRLALERTGSTCDKYYSSEIDKYAIKIADKNWPEDTEHRLGNILDWETWDVDWSSIDLLIGGSPCTNLSFAGKQEGLLAPTLEEYQQKKVEGFGFKGQSFLFWEYVAILKHVQQFNPKVTFLLENVKMKKEYKDIITSYLGVEPIEINSALVSAQNRKRLYWTNIPDVEQPKDLGIFLKDIVLSGFPICGRVVVGRARENGKRIDHKQSVAGIATQEFEPRTDGKSGTISTVQKDNLLLTERALEYMDREVKDGRTHWDFKHHSDVRDPKSAAVVANFFKGVPYNVLKDWDCIRKFDPVECERLQTVPDGYTEGVSNTRRYAALGNGWTIDVIAHIFKHMKENKC